MTVDGVTIPDMPLYAYEITSEMKDEFCELLEQGYDPAVAASKIGTTGTQMKKLYSGKSPVHYDAVFAGRVGQILKAEERDDKQEALVREYQWAAAEAGVWKAIEKLSLVYDRKWDKLRHQNFHHDHAVRMELIQYLTPEQLDEAIAKAEAAQIDGQQPLRLLEAGNDDL